MHKPKHYALQISFFIAQRLRQAHQKAFTAIVQKIGIVSVALGLATMLIAFLVMKGFHQNIEHKITSFSGHLQIVKYSLNRSAEAPPMKKSQLQAWQQQLPDSIQDVKAFAHKAVLLRSTDDVEGMVCKGLDLRATHENLRTYLTAGQLPSAAPQGYSRDVLLSARTADRLHVQVGDEVVACVVQQPPRYRKLKVVGLYSTHMTDLDEKLAFCDLRLIQRLNNWPEDAVGGYEVFLRSLDQTQEVTEQLLSWLDYDLGIQTTAEEYAPVFDWLLIVRKNALVFMALILLVISSNLASIVLIQMMERTAMIGTLKALGASDGHIRGMMLWNNLIMVGHGMFWGNLVGIGLCALQYYFRLLPLDATFYYTDHVPIAWDWGVILGLNALAFGVVTTVLLLSITIIVRLKPIQAMRFR